MLADLLMIWDPDFSANVPLLWSRILSPTFPRSLHIHWRHSNAPLRSPSGLEDLFPQLWGVLLAGTPSYQPCLEVPHQRGTYPRPHALPGATWGYKGLVSSPQPRTTQKGHPSLRAPQGVIWGLSCKFPESCLPPFLLQWGPQEHLIIHPCTIITVWESASWEPKLA